MVGIITGKNLVMNAQKLNQLIIMKMQDSMNKTEAETFGISRQNQTDSD